MVKWREIRYNSILFEHITLMVIGERSQMCVVLALVYESVADAYT